MIHRSEIDTTAASRTWSPSPADALTAITLAGAIRTVVHSGVLDVLESAGPLTTEDLAARAHVRTDSLALILATLVEGGVVERDGVGRWYPVGSAEGWRLLMLDGESPFEHFLEGVVVDDGPSGEPTTRDRNYAAAAQVLSRVTGAVADRCAPDYVQPGGNVLELGAGDAPWSRAMLAVEPSMTATAVDRPTVAEGLRRRLTLLEIGDRISVVGADVRDLQLELTYNVVVVSALCRLLDADTNEELMRRVADWARPGGRVLVFDAIRDREVRPGLAAYELSLARRTRSGRVYSLEQYTAWASAGGLRDPAIVAAGPGGHLLLEFGR